MGFETLKVAPAALRRSVLARHVGPLWGAEGAVLLTALLQTVIVARVLGPQEFGIAALAIAVPSALFTFFDPQAHEAVVRYVSRYVADDDLDRAAAVPRLAYAADICLAGIGLAVMAAATPFVVDHILKVPGTGHLLLASAAGLCAAAPISTSRSVLITFDRYTLVGRLTSLGTVLRTVLVLALLALGLRVEAVIYGSAIGYLVEAVVMGFAADAALKRGTGRSWRSVHTRILGSDRRTVLSFMAYTECTSLVTVLVKRADIVILGAVAGTRTAGYYRLAWALVSPVTSLTVPLQQVFYPKAARLAAAGDLQGLRTMIGRHTRRVGLPLAALVLMSIPALTFAVPRVFGDEYQGAVGPAAILLVGAAAGICLYWLRPTYLATGMVRPLLVMSTVAATLSILGFLIAAPLAGAAGVAAVRAVLAGVLGGAAIGAYLLRRLGPSGPTPRSGGRLVIPLAKEETT